MGPDGVNRTVARTVCLFVKSQTERDGPFTGVHGCITGNTSGCILKVNTMPNGTLISSCCCELAVLLTVKVKRLEGLL
jgi:hypothetical protein